MLFSDLCTQNDMTVVFVFQSLQFPLHSCTVGETQHIRGCPSNRLQSLRKWHCGGHFECRADEFYFHPWEVVPGICFPSASPDIFRQTTQQSFRTSGGGMAWV